MCTGMAQLDRQSTAYHASPRTFLPSDRTEFLTYASPSGLVIRLLATAEPCWGEATTGKRRQDHRHRVRPYQ
jgi:hypothetical protein